MDVSDTQRVAPVSLLDARPHRTDVFAAFGLLAAELALLGGVAVLRLPWILWLAGHLALVGWFAYESWRIWTAGRDVSTRALCVLAALVGGPAGALALIVALVLWRRQRTRPELLTAWYDRIALAGDIDDVTRLADTVTMGRAVGTSQVPPQPFDDVMAGGTLAERQAALGLIARHFSPDYAPALQAALVTSEPMVRVQAAAVATRVRAELKSEIRTAIAIAKAIDEPIGDRSAELITRFRALISTGMIEDDDRETAEAEISRLAALFAAAPPPSDPIIREQLETELLRLGDFAAFRAVRSVSEALDKPRSEAFHGP